MAASLFDRVSEFLRSFDETGARRDAPDDDTLRTARTALMVRVVDADGRITSAEREALHRIVSETYGVGSPAAREIIDRGADADREATDLYEHTAVIRRSTDEGERVRLVELLFELAYADEDLHETEDAAVKRISDLLGVDPRDRVLARRAVAERRGASVTPSSEPPG